MIHTATRLAALLFAALLAACGDDSPQTTQRTVQPSPVVEATPSAAPEPPAITDLRTPPDADGQPPVAKQGPAAERELEWDALIPDDFRPDKLMSEFQIEDLSDDDPRAAEFMAKLKALWDKAPVREDLDGAEIRLPGFVVPVEADERETTGFLLVPYYGACIHVPPPPANQTVYVITEAGKGTRPELFDVVWVTGTMSTKRIENDMAEAGYTLYASSIEPYE